MSTPNQPPQPNRDKDEDARVYYEHLKQRGQIADVTADEDVSNLPAHITHIRYPDGTVKRIRFNTSGPR